MVVEELKNQESFSYNKLKMILNISSWEKILNHFFSTGRGSKILIEGKNLDSVYRTVVRFKPNESHLKPVTRVLWHSAFSNLFVNHSFQKKSLNISWF